MAPRPRQHADPAEHRVAPWHLLLPELRELVLNRLSDEERARLAATSRTAWAEDAAARPVRRLIQRHRLLGQAGSLLGLPALTAFTEPPVPGPGPGPGRTGEPAPDWAGRALLDGAGRVWWHDDEDGGDAGGARGWWPDEDDAAGGGGGSARGWWWWPDDGGGAGGWWPPGGGGGTRWWWGRRPDAAGGARNLWPDRRPHRPVPLGGRRAVALSGGDSFVAVLCQGGDLLLWRPHWSEARLALRRVVRLAGDRTAVYALTRTGGVYAWQAAGPGRRKMWGVGAGGPHWEPQPATLSARHLSVQNRPAQLAVARDDGGSVASVYVVDRTGRAVWGCGDETMRNLSTRHLMLTPLPSPPEPIRHLLALGVGLHRRVVPADGGGEDARTGRVERYRGANGIGPLALLEDGTVWSPILARRLALQRAGRVLDAGRDGKVLGMARDDAAGPAQVRLLTAAGEHLTARLSVPDDSDACWLEVSAALDRPAA